MSIRLRIALLSTVLLALLLLGIGAGTYFTLERSMSQEIDGRLQDVVVSFRRQSAVKVNGNYLEVTFPEDFNPLASPSVYIQVLGSTNQPVAQAPSQGLKGEFLAIPDDVIARNERGESVYLTTEFRGVPFRVLSAPLLNPDAGLYIGTIQVAEPLNPLLRVFTKLRLVMFGAFAIGIGLVAVGSYMLARRSLRPLVEITATARQIGGSGDLQRRIDPPQTGDEVQELSETFNSMLARLDQAFTAERRFVSDASHELRTPLTALRGNAEILMPQLEAGQPNPTDLAEGLTDIRDEAERMGRLVENLLTLARADVGWRPDLTLVPLDQIIADVARLAAPLARNHHFEVQVPEDLTVIGNADQLKQLLIILLDNAFTYTPPGGHVTLSVTRLAAEAEIRVRDSGPGMPPEQRERVFDRFYRGAAARDQRATGAGLGLAIARWITDCHHGTITADSEPGKGTTMIVHIPLGAPAHRPPVPESRPPQPVATRRASRPLSGD